MYKSVWLYSMGNLKAFPIDGLADSKDGMDEYV